LRDERAAETPFSPSRTMSFPCIHTQSFDKSRIEVPWKLWVPGGIHWLGLQRLSRKKYHVKRLAEGALRVYTWSYSLHSWRKRHWPCDVRCPDSCCFPDLD
jgi:hypothetical protein